MNMLLSLVLAVLVVSFLVWLIDQISSIDPQYKTIAKGLLIFALVIYVLLMCISLLGGGEPVMWPWPPPIRR